MSFSRFSAVILAGTLCLQCSPSSREIPGIEGWTGEPQVARKIAAARQRVLENPESADSVGRLGMIFQAHDLHSEAIVCYGRAAELAPYDARWPYLAALSMRTDNLEGSVELFEEAFGRGADHPAFHINFGDVLAQLGRFDRAEKEYARALELEPKVTHASYGLAQLALGRGELEEARRRLEGAATVAPWHGEVRTLLAMVYQRLDRPKDAARELKTAGVYPETSQAADPVYEPVEAEAVTAVAYTTRARRLARRGQFAEAERLYRKVLAIRSGVAGDYSNLGGTLAGQGKIDEAIGLYRKALALDGDDPHALNNLAMALAQKGDSEAAVESLSRALEIEPTYAEAHHNLGLIRAGQKKFAGAIEHYQDALAHNPSFAKAHNDMGTSWAGLGDMEEAVASWRRALEIDPRELSARHNLSVALAQQGEHRESVEWLTKGLEIAPNSSRIAAFLAWELATAPEAELRDGAKATVLARRVYAAYPNRPEIGDVLAAALAESADFRSATEVAGRAVNDAVAGGKPVLAGQIKKRLAGYRREMPYRQKP